MSALNYAAMIILLNKYIYIYVCVYVLLYIFNTRRHFCKIVHKMDNVFKTMC